MSSSPRPESPSAVQTDTLLPPKAIGLHTNRDSVATTASADPSVKAHDSNSYVGVPVNELHHDDGHAGMSEKPKKKRSPLLLALIGLGLLAVVVVAVIVPVYFKVIKKDNNNNTSGNAGSGSSPSDPTPGANPTGGNNPTSGVIVTGT